MTWRIVGMVAAFTLIPFALFSAVALYYADRAIMELRKWLR